MDDRECGNCRHFRKAEEEIKRIEGYGKCSSREVAAMVWGLTYVHDSFRCRFHQKPVFVRH